MIRLLYIIALCFCFPFTATVGAATPVEDRLLGAWVIDVEATENYLRANKILPDAAVDRMHPLLAEMRLVYDLTGVQKMGKDGVSEGRTEIQILMRSEKKTVFTSTDTTGEKVTTTITWDDGAFWQETTVFPGYRERFIRAIATNK